MRSVKIAGASFEDVKREFVAFLAANGKDMPLLWIFKEDVLSRRSRWFRTDFWLKLPLPTENEELAKRHFELARTKGFGMGLSAFAPCEAGLCCSFIVPADEEDSQYILVDQSAIRFAVTTEPFPEVKIVRNDLTWKLLSFLPWMEKGNYMVYLASKADL